jgi:hypothetical protein
MPSVVPFETDPAVFVETVEQRIARYEEGGTLDPKCGGCTEHYAAIRRTGEMAFAPRHKASQRCESGRRNHCSCSTCF